VLNTAAAESETRQIKLGRKEKKKETLLFHALFNRTYNAVFLLLNERIVGYQEVLQSF